MSKSLKKIIVAHHYGFCMGVKRAIKIAEQAGQKEIGPVSVINEIVHNDSVVRNLKEQGVGTVLSVSDAPGGTVIISAHGAPPAYFREAARRGLKVIDATCPLVIKIHRIINKLVEDNYRIIHFGDRHHDETKGVVGQARPGRVVVVSSPAELDRLTDKGGKYALTSQTTADAAEFERIATIADEKFANIEIYNTVCNATEQRQAAVLSVAPQVDLMLVVGSSSSANSKRLRNISETACGKAYLIDNSEDLTAEMLKDIEVVGLSAGASTPDYLVEDVISRLKEFSSGTAELVRKRRDDSAQCRLAHDEKPNK